jgi:cell division protein FtsZ
MPIPESREAQIEKEEEKVPIFSVKAMSEEKIIEPKVEEVGKIIHDLYGDSEKKVEKNTSNAYSTTPSFGNVNYELFKQTAIQRAHERFEKLKSNRTYNSSFEEMKEKMNVPAYQRKNVVLNEPQHSSEPLISKYNLNSENEILGNNRFLHDNVD